MPHLSGTYSSSGPILDVWVGVSAPRARVMIARGLQLPEPHRLSFLIDTGADTTMVSEQAMRLLGIPERGARRIVGSTTHIEPTTCSAYDVQFEMRTHGDPPRIFPALEVLARPFFNVSIEGLIGRDVLDQMQLTLGRGRFRLDY